jgi:hypothetical protein
VGADPPPAGTNQRLAGANEWFADSSEAFAGASGPPIRANKPSTRADAWGLCAVRRPYLKMERREAPTVTMADAA